MSLYTVYGKRLPVCLPAWIARAAKRLKMSSSAPGARSESGTLSAPEPGSEVGSSLVQAVTCHESDRALAWGGQLRM